MDRSSPSQMPATCTNSAASQDAQTPRQVRLDRRLTQTRPVHPQQKRHQWHDGHPVHVLFLVPALHEDDQCVRIDSRQQSQQRRADERFFEASVSAVMESPRPRAAHASDFR